MIWRVEVWAWRFELGEVRELNWGVEDAGGATSVSTVREVLERTKAKDTTEISHRKERRSEIRCSHPKSEAIVSICMASGYDFRIHNSCHQHRTFFWGKNIYF